MLDIILGVVTIILLFSAVLVFVLFLEDMLGD